MSNETNKSNLDPNIMGFSWLDGGKIGIAIIFSKDTATGLVDEEGKPILGFPIACISAVSGLDEESDLNKIVNWGGYFPIDLAEQVINRCGAWLKPAGIEWRPRAETNSPLKFKLKYKGKGKEKDT